MSMETNDHDLLVRLDTKVELVINQLGRFNDAVSSLAERVAALENKDSRDSEKVSAISKDVQISLSNKDRINSLEAQIASLKDDIKAMQGKSNLWDIVNGVGIAIATIIGYVK